ncbi:MAG: hypothetical protein RL398_959 [Planctomycetota bacterium]
MKRSRSITLLAATIALGLLSRRFPLPGLLAEHLGDALYATAAAWLATLLRPSLRAADTALAGFAIATLVECQQLLDWGWLVELRHTRVGALVLGQGFQAADLLAYACGALLAGAVAAACRDRAGAATSSSPGCDRTK